MITWSGISAVVARKVLQGSSDSWGTEPTGLWLAFPWWGEGGELRCARVGARPISAPGDFDKKIKHPTSSVAEVRDQLVTPSCAHCLPIPRTQSKFDEWSPTLPPDRKQRSKGRTGEFEAQSALVGEIVRVNANTSNPGKGEAAVQPGDVAPAEVLVLRPSEWAEPRRRGEPEHQVYSMKDEPLSIL